MFCRQVLGVLLLASMTTGGNASADSTQPKKRSKRDAVERLLEEPLGWNFGDEKTVTLAAFIAHVREKHGLNIRLDAPALIMNQGTAEAMFSGEMASSSRPATIRMAADVKATDPAPKNATIDLSQKAGPAPEMSGAQQTGMLSSLLISLNPADFLAAAQEPENAAESPTVENSDQPVLRHPPHSPDDDQASSPTPIDALLTTPMPRTIVSFEGATIGEALQQLLDVMASPMPLPMAMEMGLPVTTHAFTLEYIVENRGVVITSRLKANAAKETRVYRLATNSRVKPDELVRVLTHSVRPWSWRSQATEIADTLAARWPKGNMPELPQISFGGNLGGNGSYTIGTPAPAPSATGPVTPASGVEPSKPMTPADAASTGQLMSGGGLAMVQALIAAVEIAHYGDPPTGTIEALPGMLIITQSQAAHREIATLLDDISNASDTTNR